MCDMWASSDVRCRFLEHFFLALSCFGSGGTGLASPGRSALASVPEPCSSRHAAWLHFADFCSCGDWVSNPVFHNIPWHRRLACTCTCTWRFWETIRVIFFYRWFSWGRTIVCPRLMLSFIIKFSAGQCLMMYDRYWYIETHVSYMSLAVTSNLQIRQNINLSKNWILSILQSNDYVQFPLCYQKEKSGGNWEKLRKNYSVWLEHWICHRAPFCSSERWILTINTLDLLMFYANFLWWNTIFIFKQSYCLHLDAFNIYTLLISPRNCIYSPCLHCLHFNRLVPPYWIRSVFAEKLLQSSPELWQSNCVDHWIQYRIKVIER